jgi:death-on-curing protein
VSAIYYLDIEDVLTAGRAACGKDVEVRDLGLLSSAVARPSTSVFGVDPYPDLFTKAAALMDSLARNHALLDGNKRTAWAAAWTFLEVNGHRLAEELDTERAEEFVLAVAQGRLDVPEIAIELQSFSVG